MKTNAMKKYIPLLFILLFFSNKSQAQDSAYCSEITNNLSYFLEHQMGDSVYIHFDKQMKKAIDVTALNAIWGQLSMLNGAFEEKGKISIKSQDDYKVYEQSLHFANKSLRLKLSFNAQNEIIGMFFVPLKTNRHAPKLRDDEWMKEEKISVGPAESSLDGIFTRPKGVDKFPIVILVHGSGQHDKDETIGPNKPFKVIAEELAKNKIGSIRYDKRAEPINKISCIGSEIEEFVVNDAISAIALAYGIEGVDTTKIIVVGHSLGGMLAPWIASKSSRVKGIILLAGNSRPMEDLILEQNIYLLSRDGLTKVEKKQIKELKKQVKNVKNLSKLKDPTKTAFPMGISYSYWKEAQAYSQTKTASNLKVPILVLQGERDYQVTMADFELWKKSLVNNNNVSFKSFKGLNHLFCYGESVSYPEEYFQACPLSMDVILEINAWIMNTTF